MAVNTTGTRTEYLPSKTPERWPYNNTLNSEVTGSVRGLF